jgi:hypothetical protein
VSAYGKVVMVYMVEMFNGWMVEVMAVMFF